MQRTLSIALTAALCGGVAGGVAGLVAGGDSSDAPTAQQAALATVKTATTPAAIYRRDAPGVVVITDTETSRSRRRRLQPPSSEKVSRSARAS